MIVNIISAIIVSVLLGVSLFLMMQSRKIREKLAESERRYRLITENAKDIIYRLSLPEGKYEYISPACNLLTGYSAQEFYSKPKFLRTILDPEFIDIFDKHWNELLKVNSIPT